MALPTKHSSSGATRAHARRGGLRELAQELAHVPFVRTPASALLAVAVLYLLGGLSGVITLLLEKDPHYLLLNWMITIASLGLGVAFISMRHRVNWRVPNLAYLGGTLMVTSAIYLDESMASSNVYMYMWVVILTAYFFRLSEALAQAGFMVACYGTVLLITESYDPLDHFVFFLAVCVSLAVFLNLVRSNMLEAIDELSGAARTDALTGLHNRRGLYEDVEVLISDFREIGMLLCDIDFFKQVNDQYGHEQGDQALVKLATLLVDLAPAGSVIGRLGGEEFAIAVPDIALPELEELALTLVRVCSTALDVEGTPITISVGFVLSGQVPHDLDSLFQAADAATYSAKEFGRNRAVGWSQDVSDFVASTAERASKQREIQLATLSTLCEALDLRDPYTHNHCHVVAELSYELALELGMEERQAGRVRVAGTLHDIGKIGIPDEILYKPGKLTDEEFRRMQSHPEIGARLLNSVDMLDIREWVLSHHERMDGTGYPRQRAGELLPLGARILSVADALEAMLADRAYRKGMPFADALAELHRCAGTQFDVDVVSAVLPVIERRPDIVELVRSGPGQDSESRDSVRPMSATPNIHLDLAATLLAEDPADESDDESLAA